MQGLRRLHYLFAIDSPIWVQCTTLVTMASCLLLLFYLISQMVHSTQLIAATSLAFSAIFDACIAVAAYILAFSTRSAFRYFFLLVAIEETVRLFASGLFVSKYLFFGELFRVLDTQSFTPTHAFFLFVRPLYFTLFLAFIFIKLKPRLRLLIPSVSSLLVVFLVVGYILRLYFLHHSSFGISIWFVVEAIHDVIVFLILAQCFPLAKNNSIYFIVIGYLFFVASHIFSIRMQYSLPYFNEISFSLYIWLIANLFLLKGFLSLLSKKNQDATTWFYSFDSEGVQVGYWSVSIVSILFLLIISRNILLIANARDEAFIFQMCFAIYIAYVGFLALIMRPFSQLFIKDISAIDSLIKPVEQKQVQQPSFSAHLYFNEFRHLNKILKNRMRTMVERRDYENKLYQLASDIAVEIRQPLGRLLANSKTIEDQLDIEQQRIYKNALMRINQIADDFHVLRKDEQLNPQETLDEPQWCKYISIVFYEYMLEKKIQYEETKIILKTQISTECWFVLAQFVRSDFQRVLSNLINNAVEATEGNKVRKVSVSMSYEAQDRRIMIKVADNGCGMNKKQLKELMVGQSQSTKLQGFGIGLQYVLEKIKQWNGEFLVASKKGDRTTFTLQLPSLSELPVWWVDKIHLHRGLRLVVFRADQPLYEAWRHLTVDYIRFESELRSSLSAVDSKLIVLNVNSEEDARYWVELIKTYDKQQKIIVVSAEYDSPVIRALCLQQKIQLLPSALVRHIKVEADNENA